MIMKEERQLLVEFGKKLIERNLTKGSGGNLSIYNRKEGLIAITPSGMDYFETTPEDILVVDIHGIVIQGDKKPSSETGMHLIFYRNREDIQAIVHTHSIYATAISCMGWTLEPVHYLIGLAGQDVKCAEYATYGTEQLAQNAFDAAKDRDAVLLANHGLLALGSDIAGAFSAAEHLEFVSQLYCATKAMGQPNILNPSQMTDVMKKFNTYKYK